MLSQNSECYSGSICRTRHPVGMGGADVSLGTIAQSIAGLDAWRVNAELWTSKEAEAHKYTSAMRTLYSVGGVAEKALYEELLSGKTNIEVNRDGAYLAKTEANGDGTKTIYLGQEALEKGSRFGMNILLAHEAYRNGIDDGEAGQREETDRAVLGHIGAALALGKAYGMGSIGAEMATEVNKYLAAIKTGEQKDKEEFAKLLESYKSSADYWKVIKDKDGKVSQVIDDGDYEHINVYKADGTLEKQVEYMKGQSLILSVLHAAEGIRGEKEDANYNRINKVLMASGLDYKSGSGWYAKTEAAIQAKNREIAARNAQEAVQVKKEGFLDQLGRSIQDALTMGGIYKEAEIANQRANKLILDWIFGGKKEEKRAEKTEPEKGITKAELEKRYNEVAEKPYTSDLSDEVLNSNGAVTKESKGMNCIGFVSYVFGFNCRYDVSNFHLYTEFEKLQITSVDQLKVGDVIRWMGINKDDSTNNNHVMIWYGNDTILESAFRYGVQMRDYASYLKWFNDKYTNITVDYFRFKGSKRTGGSE